MNVSSAANFPSHTLDVTPWQSVVSHIAAVLTAIIFIAAGLFHALDPFGVQRLFEQVLVWPQISMALVLAVSVADTLAGVLILIPRYRRWGAWLAVALLAVYLTYFGYHYSQLAGKECSCFPWVKRTIGPAFFAGDAGILVMALLAGWWARPPVRLRGAIAILGAIAVFAGASYGYAAAHLSGTKAPDTITVNGKPFSLQHGSIFVFFYDPHCSHCDEAAHVMAKLHWKDDVSIIAVPTTDARFAASFLHDTGLKASTSLDVDQLKKAFPFGDPPYGVALESGREKGPVSHYDSPEPAETLRKLGFVD